MTRHGALATLGVITAVVAVIALAPRVASAHDAKTMGVVKSVEAMHLMVQTSDGDTATFMIDHDTKIRRGETPVAAADLEAGERVVVVYSTHEEGEEEGEAHDVDHHAEAHGEMSVAKEIMLADR